MDICTYVRYRIRFDNLHIRLILNFDIEENRLDWKTRLRNETIWLMINFQTSKTIFDIVHKTIIFFSSIRENFKIRKMRQYLSLFKFKATISFLSKF